MKFFASLFLAASTVGLTEAALAFTKPVATSSIAAGTAFTLTWQDDGNAPTLATFGTATFSLAIGGTVSQAIVQSLGSVDTSTNNKLSVTISPSAGPSGQGIYFIRADSSTIDPSSAFGAPYQAFSAKFDLTGGTGTFNSTLAAIAAGGSPAASSSAAVSSASGSATITTSGRVLTSTPFSSSSRSTITTTVTPTLSITNTSSDATFVRVAGVGMTFGSMILALLSSF